MSGALGIPPSLAIVHSALTCVTDSAGQPVCTGTSAGLFAGLGIFLFVYLALAVLGIIAAVKVVTKAGYSGWWILIAFVPFVGTVFFFIFAFSTWPVTREVQMLRSQLVGARGYGRPTGPGRPPTAGGSLPGLPPTGPPGVAGQAWPPGSAVPPGTPGAVPVVGSAAPPADPEAVVESAVLPTFGQFIRGETPDPSPGAAVDPPPPAGWFPSPGGPPGQLRYWDGTGWTDHVQPGP
jgi:uncharacterized membrane protein YhaH (DUF805 family)